MGEKVDFVHLQVRMERRTVKRQARPAQMPELKLLNMASFAMSTIWKMIKVILVRMMNMECLKK